MGKDQEAFQRQIKKEGMSKRSGQKASAGMRTKQCARDPVNQPRKAPNFEPLAKSHFETPVNARGWVGVPEDESGSFLSDTTAGHRPSPGSNEAVDPCISGSEATYASGDGTVGSQHIGIDQLLQVIDDAERCLGNVFDPSLNEILNVDAGSLEIDTSPTEVASLPVESNSSTASMELSSGDAIGNTTEMCYVDEMENLEAMNMHF